MANIFIWGGGVGRLSDSLHSYLFLKQRMGEWFISWNAPKPVLNSPVCMGRKFIITSLNGSLKYPFILKMFGSRYATQRKSDRENCSPLGLLPSKSVIFFNLNLRDNQYTGMHSGCVFKTANCKCNMIWGWK